MEVDDVEYMYNETKCYILDLAAIIRSIMRTSDTFRELANKNTLQDIPKQYDAIYIACDTYRSYSIKNAERSLRGDEDKFFIRSPDVRIPADLKKFLNNGENKERMFELIEEVWIQSRNQNDRRTIYFARSSSCIKIANEVLEPVPELNTDHEEADTKIAYLVQHALRENGDNTCVVRSSSGDIDIPGILVAANLADRRIFIDNGTGRNHKSLKLSACELSQEQKKALLGLHAFSGNDYVSCIFRKGKQLCWKNVKNISRFLDLFSTIGTNCNLTNDQLQGLEHFICTTFGKKRLHSVNEARRQIFWEKLQKDNKIIDLSLLPPCQSSLELHCKRANFVAKMWRDASNPMLLSDNPVMHGWLPDMNIEWIKEAYPSDITELLFDSDVEDDNEYYETLTDDLTNDLSSSSSEEESDIEDN